jgi:putative transcriptional regulator
VALTKTILENQRICKVNLTFFAKQTILKMQSRLSKGGGTIKTRIPELRRERKLSQEELAREVGTTRQTITSIEVGRYTASLPLAYKIAHYFGLTIEEVFDFSELEGEVRHG